MPSDQKAFIHLLTLCAALCISQTAYAVQPTISNTRYWLPLTQDELHDPALDSIKLLQNPEEALSKLPREEGAGNQVNWVKALEGGYIKPHINVLSNNKSEILNLDVLLPNTGEMNLVLFPHKQHTEWLACVDCHEAIFKSKAGATKFGMFDILNGEYCGRCHSSVAFPLTECKRCHNVPRSAITTPVQTH